MILPVHQLRIYSASYINSFQLIGAYKPNVLDISRCANSIDIEHCKGVSTLVLGNCYKIENIDKFSDIKVCKLRGCTVNPVQWSIFSSLQVFELTKCESMTDSDVSALAHIRDLTLIKCPNITNIDSLTRNDKLSICNCPGIQVISLSDHPRDEVCIKNISNLIEIAIAGKVKTLQLRMVLKSVETTW